jgi:hypothetical protein
VGKKTLCYEIAKLFLVDAESFQTVRERGGDKLDRLIAAKSHPDYVQLSVCPPVQEVRQLTMRCRQTRVAAPWRVIVIPQADELGTHAVSALLKGIEEAPPQTVFLLTATGSVPQTLASRCSKVSMPPLDAQTFQSLIAEWIPKEIQQDPLFTIVCQGCLGRAQRLKNEMPLIQQTWDLFSRCGQQPVIFPKQWQDQTEEHWETIRDVFFLWCHHQATSGAFAEGFLLRVITVWELGQELFGQYKAFHTDWRTLLYALGGGMTRILSETDASSQKSVRNR